MNGVLHDTRGPATTRPSGRLKRSRWRGAVWALSGLMCCLMPAMAGWSALSAQTSGRAANSPTRPGTTSITRTSGVQGQSAEREPWQSLLEPEQTNENPIVDILIEGNVTIPDSSIQRLIKTRKGRPATPKSVREDVKALFETRWFTGVTPIYRTTEEGTILIFRVIEAPILDNVTYVGNKKIKTKVLEGVTGLRKGGPFGVTLNREAARAIERYYKDKGYHFCKVELTKGDKDTEREAEFQIEEGHKTYVRGTQFVGNKFFSPGELKLHLKTSVRLVPLIPIGGSYSPGDLDEDVAGLREYYQKVGFLEAKITAKAEFAEDKSYVTMVYTIDEGTRFKVGKISVKGNDVISEATLRKDFKLAENEFFNSDKLSRDIDEMTNKYGALGRLFAEVNANSVFLPEQPGVVDIIYTINEDKVYRIRRVDVVISGNSGSPSHTKDSVVLNQMLLGPGDLASKPLIKKSERRLASSSFFANAQSGQAPKIDIRRVNDMYSRPGVPDFVRAQGSNLEDGVAAPPRKKEPLYPIPVFPKDEPVDTPVQSANFTTAEDAASEVEPISTTTRSRATIRNAISTQETSRGVARPISHSETSTSAFPVRRSHRIPLEAAEESTTVRTGDVEQTAKSVPETDYQPPQVNRPRSKPGKIQYNVPPTKAAPAIGEPSGSKPRNSAQSSATRSNSTPPNADRDAALNQLFNQSPEQGNMQAANEAAETEPAEEESPFQTIIRAQGPGLDGAPAQNPLFNNSPQGNPLGNPMLNPSPDAPGYVDLIPEVAETQTGRISFGVGINSDAGFLGNAVVDESNFDITRVPTSFRDILNGTAFRGGGQQFRLEAVPGNQVSRYMLSWRDPYFLNTNNSLGVSGFYYTRIFQDWTETRAGGNIKVGRQFDNFTSGVVTLRLEDVELSSPPHNPPQLLTDSLGHNTLSTLRLGLIHDTRDSAFLPTEGHYLEGGYEQAFGEFHYPRVDMIARQYFTTYQRADGEGRHILALSGQMSYTGNDTPIFERLYAGGITSFRGFQFRGVTPVQSGVGVGGTFMALGSVEYIFPFTASETVRGVVFTDFGTVEDSVSFHDFRASAGAGLRITIPAMGPLPIALDLAWPIKREDFDQTRLFNFYVGFLR